MLEAWLFRGMIWALSCRSVITVKPHPCVGTRLTQRCEGLGFRFPPPLCLAHCWSYVGVCWCLLIISIFSRAFLR